MDLFKATINRVIDTLFTIHIFSYSSAFRHIGYFTINCGGYFYSVFQKCCNLLFQGSCLVTFQ